MNIPERLSLSQIAPGAHFHGALVNLTARGPVAAAHRHDFTEMFYVLAGAGVHPVNGETLPLSVGDLVLIRPDDSHAVCARPKANLLFINIAFHNELWEAWVAAAGVTPDVVSWDRSRRPPSVRVPDGRCLEAAAAFQRALWAAHEAPTRLELCRFWSATLPLLVGDSGESISPAGPAWLARACRSLRDESNLRGGVARLVALSGVSAAHLSRVLKQQTGQTPTAYVNDLRLARAAILLTTTPDKIIGIADDCGFENLSHFYRQFRLKHGVSPHAYRLQAQQGVVP